MRGFSRWLLAGSVILLELPSTPVAAQSPAGPVQQSRTDRLLYTLPSGWTRTEKDAFTVLHAPSVPAGRVAEIRILPAKPLTTPLQAVATAEGERLKRTYARVQVAPVSVVRHPNGFEIAIAGASMANASAPSVFIYQAQCFVRSGDHVQPLVLETSDYPLYQAHKAAFDALLQSVRVTDSIVLARGNPTLTQATLDSLTDFLEWLIEVPFTEEQRQVIAHAVIDSWKKNDRPDIQGVQDVLKLRAQLATMTAEQKMLVRQTAQPEVIKTARSETDAISKVVVQVYDAAHKPIAAGNPPLTRQAADAMLEVLFFMASQVRLGDTAAQPSPTPQMKEVWANNLAANYGKTDAAARKSIAGMPITWAALRMTWPDLPAADKAKARAQWGRSNEVKQVAEVMTRLGQPATGGTPTPATQAGGQKYWAEGKNVMMQTGNSSWVLYAEESEVAAEKTAAERNKDNEKMVNPSAAAAADLMAQRTRDYTFTKSMLDMGARNTIMQMGAISGSGWRYR
jgi:hypothetical protein